MSSRPPFTSPVSPSAPAPRADAPVALRYPFREADVRALRTGMAVTISGTIYTGRDRLHRYLADGGAAPADLHDGAIYHCGPVVVPDAASPAGWRIVAAGPTTSSRENPYMPKIIRGLGLRVILGKGGMGPETQAACRECGCVYIQAVGGAATWLAQCIRRVEAVWFLNEFGATEAMWKLTVEGLSGIVAIDANGESLFAGVEQISRDRLVELIGRPLVLDPTPKEQRAGQEYAPPRESAGAPPPMRVVFMGSADVSCVVLRELCEHEAFSVQGVVTQPDRPSGRNRRLQPCLAKAAALERGLPVISPEKVNAPDVRQQIADWRPDVIVVVAYGQFLGGRLLALPPLGCVNVHLSLLPRHRGAAPVTRCIEAGDTVSGVTIMRMDHGMDSGDILMQEQEAIRPDDTAGALRARLSEIGARLLVRCLPRWRAGLITPTPQKADEVTFANKLSKDEGHLMWMAPSAELARRVMAFNPWPACFAYIELPKHGVPVVERIKVLRARAEAPAPGAPAAIMGTVADLSREGPAIATADGWLRLLEIQRPGGRPISGADFVRSCPLFIGQSFDVQPPPKDA